MPAVSSASAAVLDASALLAFLQREPGHQQATDALSSGSAISAVNLSEVVAKLRDTNAPETTIRQALSGLMARGLAVIPFDEALAFATGCLRPVTREFGLSFGDRASLALGQARNEPVLTADRGWTDVARVVGVDVRIIR
jgi:ribonuclease VapC